MLETGVPCAALPTEEHHTRARRMLQAVRWQSVPHRTAQGRLPARLPGTPSRQDVSARPLHPMFMRQCYISVPTESVSGSGMPTGKAGFDTRQLLSTLSTRSGIQINMYYRRPYIRG